MENFNKKFQSTTENYKFHLKTQNFRILKLTQFGCLSHLISLVCISLKLDLWSLALLPSLVCLSLELFPLCMSSLTILEFVDLVLAIGSSTVVICISILISLICTFFLLLRKAQQLPNASPEHILFECVPLGLLNQFLVGLHKYVMLCNGHMQWVQSPETMHILHKKNGKGNYNLDLESCFATLKCI